MTRASGIAGAFVVALALAPMSAAAQFTSEIPIPTSNSHPNDIAVSPDGALWFTEQNGNNIGRITINGVIMNEFGITSGFQSIRGITRGPAATDPNSLWFTEINGSNIARISSQSPFTITEFSVILNGFHPQPNYITSGSDGALWFTYLNDGGGIGRITTNGQLTDLISLKSATAKLNSTSRRMSVN
jgi:virginiamycin B lyase